MKSFNDELTEFVPSYDGRNKEPVTLPASCHCC
jgi:DNA gyrase/topoisomerase IV subunit A